MRCKFIDATKEEENIVSLPGDLKSELSTFLKSCLSTIGRNAQKIREIRKKKEYAKSKFMDRGGDSNWRNSKFVYVISAIKAMLYDIDSYLQLYMDMLNKLCVIVATLNRSNSLYVQGKYVHLSSQENHVALDESVETNEPRLIKQRSEKWLEIRKEALVTGSTFYQALGLDGLKNQKEHFEKVICGLSEKPKSKEIQNFLEYGSENEPNAVATLVGKIMPVLYPHLTYYEEGCIPLYVDQRRFMVVSPDGSLRQNDDLAVMNGADTHMGVEFKCPVFQSHTSLPERYVLQCLSEMEVLNVDSLLYICWRPQVTTVFEIHHSRELFQRTFELAKSIYLADKPKRPTKLPDELKVMKKQIQEESSRAVFLGEFPSAFSGSAPIKDTIVYVYSNRDIIALMNTIERLIREGYELQRQKASEAMVFLCSDLDRNWSKSGFRWAPVCWFPKGYSLSTDTLRTIVERVHTECELQGIHIPAESFDGQWHNLVVRTVKGEPLTIFQLQKDVWHDTEKLQKSQITKEFRNLNRKPQWMKNPGQLIFTNGGERLPRLTKRWIDNKRQDKGKKDEKSWEEEKETERSVPSLADAVPGEVLGSSLLVDEEQSELPVDETIERFEHFLVDGEVMDAIESSNVKSDKWIEVTSQSRGLQVMDMDSNVSIDSDWFWDSQEETHVVSETERTISSKTTLTLIDATAIVAMLRTDSNANKKGIWDARDPSYLVEACSTAARLNKLRDIDLKVVVRYLRQKGLIKITESVSKKIKLDKLCELFGLSDTEKSEIQNKGTRQKSVKRLCDLAAHVLSTKVSKQALNVAYAEYVWPSRLATWQMQSTLPNTVKVDGMMYPEYWFYTPEYSTERQKLEVRCIDSTHLLTRARRKTCKGGIEDIDNKPWLRVAKTNKTYLTLIMVEDVVDPMSVEMALTHFSEEVEREMVANRDMDAAFLCRDIRNWWKSEDEPGISAKDRIVMRMGLRRRLLNLVDFSIFPPATQYVKGWPCQLWEALIANIDSKTILYALSNSGTYNVRAFSSMMGETFFSELTNQDRRGHGTVAASEFAHFIGTSIEQLELRLDPRRSFPMRMSKTTVYKVVDNDTDNTVETWQNMDDTPIVPTPLDSHKQTIHGIRLKDHFFDSEDRRRVAGRKKYATVSTDRNALQKGALGVRWEKARLNEAKILPSRKMGIPDD